MQKMESRRDADAVAAFAKAHPRPVLALRRRPATGRAQQHRARPLVRRRREAVRQLAGTARRRVLRFPGLRAGGRKGTFGRCGQMELVGHCPAAKDSRNQQSVYRSHWFLPQVGQNLSGSACKSRRRARQAATAGGSTFTARCDGKERKAVAGGVADQSPASRWRKAARATPGGWPG